jgi:NAD(P)-dependent dehydrogenase (short-subunit alcohol dehydrogenase family)
MINVTSVAGRLSGAGFGIYCASKWALEAYSLALRVELASSGIDVVVVEPGPFATELFGQAPAPADVDGRTGTYPAELLEAWQQLGSGFEAMFADPNVPTDPADVVQLFVALAEQEAGTRKLRHAIGIDFGVSEFNEEADKFEASVLKAINMDEVGRLRV